MARLSMLIALVLLSAGCTHRVTDFTFLSTKNVDLSRVGDYERTTRETGDSAVPIIFTIPLGQPSVKEAIDRAIESIPGGVALVDGVVYHRYLWFILGGENRIWVEGEVLVDPRRRTPAALKRHAEKKREDEEHRKARMRREDP